MNITPGLLVVGLYAGLNGLLLLALSMNTVRARRGRRISMGDGGDARMLRIMRAHGNFTEYAPYCLILMGLLAASGAPLWQLHLLGIGLTAGRLLHAWHFTQSDAPSWQRVGGMALTLTVLAGGSLALIARSAAGIL